MRSCSVPLFGLRLRKNRCNCHDKCTVRAESEWVNGQWSKHIKERPRECAECQAVDFRVESRAEGRACICQEVRRATYERTCCLHC